jgi:hypothetical protein
VEPRAGLDNMEKRKFLTLPGFKLRPLRRPAHSQSLYRLRYPGSLTFLRNLWKLFRDTHGWRAASCQTLVEFPPTETQISSVADDKIVTFTVDRLVARTRSTTEVRKQTYISQTSMV